jgi:hypothetical protein
MARDYTRKITEFWPTIMQAWEEHGEKRPVIECDLAKGTVAAYPANDYIGGLTERTRKATRQQFDRVVAQGGLMVFIRDSENGILQSHTFFPSSQSRAK